jgi:hypothetical protein
LSNRDHPVKGHTEESIGFFTVNLTNQASLLHYLKPWRFRQWAYDSKQRLYTINTLPAATCLEGKL